MPLLDSENLQALRHACSDTLETLLQEEGVSDALREHDALHNHLLFHRADRFESPVLSGLAEVERFRNSFFWFRVLCLRLEAESGPDAGREQQLHQLLESAPTDLDWSAMEQLDELAKSEQLRAMQRDPRIDGMVADIDRRVAAQVKLIIARPELRALERIWRSVKRLLDDADGRENIRFEILSCTKQELADDVRDNLLERTVLFQRLYSAVFRAPDGERVDPYGAVIADYEFGPDASDTFTLGFVGRCAWIGHCPFIAGASPSLLREGAERFEQTQYDHLQARRDAPAMARFAALRDSDEARFIVLTMPRVAVRESYDGEDEPLWGLACWPLATRLANSFARYRWCPNIIGSDPEAGGVVRGFQPETEMSERQEHALSEFGLVPLVNMPDDEVACFFSASTLARPRSFGVSEEGRAAEVDFRLGSCELPYLMILCRVAQYLLAVHRDSTWAERERVDQERELNRWLSQYVADRNVLSSAVRCRRMLRKALVRVEDAADQTGWRILDLKLRPHFKHLGAFFTLRVVGRLPRAEPEA